MALNVRRIHVMGEVADVKHLLDMSLEWLALRWRDDMLNERRQAVIFRSVPKTRRGTRQRAKGEDNNSELDGVVQQTMRGYGSAA